MNSELSIKHVSIPLVLVLTVISAIVLLAYNGYSEAEETQDKKIQALELSRAATDAQYSAQMANVSAALETIATHQEQHVRVVSTLEDRVQRLEIKTNNEP